MRNLHFNVSLILVIPSLLFLLSCNQYDKTDAVHIENWTQRTIDISANDSLEYGKSYLSIYSQIYSLSQHRRHNLTTMVSLRNTSNKDSIYLLKTEYYDTHGASVRVYFDTPVYLAPMETTEIIIDEIDNSGGTGSNFIIEWKIPKGCPEPIFQGIMNSTMGQQGLSFTTTAKRIE